MQAVKLCTNCSSPAMLLCSRCNDSYCTVECQKIDWPRHRPVCFQMPKLVPDLPALEINMKVNLSSSRSYSNGISPRADESLIKTCSQLAISGGVEPEAVQPKINSAPIQKKIDASVSAPVIEAPVSAPVIPKRQEPVQNGVHLSQEETNPMKVQQTPSSLKSPIPTSVLKSQAAMHSVRKAAEPPKRVMITDLKQHQWQQTSKIRVKIISAVENNILTLHEDDQKIESEYERIAAEIAEYCKDKKSCGYTPSNNEVILALYEKEWYRAQVLEADEGGFIVRYLEYGNLSLVQAEEAMPLPDQLKFEIYAQDFVIDNMPEERSEKQDEILESLAITITNIKESENGVMHCEILGF